ncbi:MarC family protein [Sulfuriroseicoccus oceanibius]|uniref:UPF0056 membrane protein n=1 Tax=Sulfuriroseicoccus oceanibius TaxID=2707525 RepID=A0A6B3L187_9BACT|nr:MarC family protein [Sulfuriroseicoccus oceanibius]QQL43782.1 MarC family protein [Sulfuriroseicoccus oceanibius]
MPEMLSLALLLFLVMDPFGNLVVVNSLLGKHTTPKRRQILLRESAIATVILLTTAWGGKWLLSALGLGQASLSISGGIVLFMIAIGMLFPSRRMIDDEIDDNPLIVPLAMPLIAGPSALSMVILFGEKHTGIDVYGAILLASAASAFILWASPWVFAFLGRRGANALERLIGMLLIMISVQMVIDGVSSYLNLPNP